MRSQGPNQEPEPRKSVFDRLGRQIDTSRPMNRRPSPGLYGEYMAPPPPPHMHDVEFGRYGRGDSMGRGEMDWRFQNDRRHDRHPGGPLPPPPPPPVQQVGPPGPPMYDMDMGGRGPPMPPYFPHPHMYNQPGPPPHPMGPGGPPMGPMHQRRSSPKYDRHGNPIMRGGPMMMDHHPGMSPPRNYPPMPGPMMGPPHEMHPMRHMGMYMPPRWHDNLEPDFHPDPSRIMQENRFSPFGVEPHRFNPQLPREDQPELIPFLENETPKYTKWRERRDVITTLDKETAQSSSRTDSLRSSLQQPDNRNTLKNLSGGRDPSNSVKTAPSQVTKKESQGEAKRDTANKGTKRAPKVTDPQDISDGEIIDDEDSSDESDANSKSLRKDPEARNDMAFMNRSKNLSGHYNRSRDFYEPAKKRRLLERDDCVMDYETISDEDLDDFMDDKKISADDASGEDGDKNVSEIELLNALGLDWAHLVEMARQSKSSNKEASSGSALSRFLPANYIPTLGITAELAGPEIYELIQNICKA